MHEPPPGTGTITLLLSKVRDGDVAAREALFDRAYPEMRRLARSFIVRNRALPSDGATAMVNQVCERLLSQEALTAQDRRHFFALFGRKLHDLMIDEYRAAHALKRGGGFARKEFLDSPMSELAPSGDLIDLRDALEEFRKHDPEAAEVVNLRFFCGQTLEQVAATLQCSLATVRQHSDYGIAWLRVRLRA